MKTSINALSLLLLLICLDLFTDRTCAFNEKSSDQIESDLLDDVPSGNEHYQAGERSLSKLIHPNFHKRRSDSAEKYFHWASKTNRPMEYWRGKRFWLFAKNDEQVRHYGALPHTGASTGSLSQGIWRSGIVGRRRR